MHAPSAMLAGAVLTFGAAALANLYLPPVHARKAAAVPPLIEAVAQPAPGEYAAASMADPRQELVMVPAPTAVPVGEPAQAAASVELPDQTPAPRSEPAAQPAPVAAETPAAPAERVAPAPVRETPPAKDRANSSPASSEAPAKALEEPKVPAAGRPAAREERDEREEKKVEAPAPEKKADRADAEPERREARRAPVVRKPAPKPAPQGPAISVSAVSGNRAWIRIDNLHTVMVTPGQSIPALGRVKSVTPTSVIFENGTVLEVSR